MKLRLAIVDDEEIVCRRLSQALAKEELAIEAFIIGRSFLERMMQDPFDIVLLDMRLPDMDGLEILSRIKALRPETEVIIITGYKSMESAVEAIRAACLPAKVIIGGAPVTQAYCDAIGADGYSADAASAADLARQLIAG